MWRRTLWGLCSAAVLALCTTAWCEEGRPQQRGGGPGPRMGGMTPPASSMWGMLLRNETVQKELELVDDQKNSLKELMEKTMTKMREQFEGMRDLSREEREAKFAELRPKLEAQAEETKKAIEGILLPHQVERLKQIVIQVQGTRALGDAEVQKSLDISDEQKEKIKSVQEATGEKMRELFSSGNREGMREKSEAIRKEANDQLLGVLTDKQKETFEKLKGEKIELDMASLFQRPGGRGPGGDRGPGEGGRRPNRDN